MLALRSFDPDGAPLRLTESRRRNVSAAGELTMRLLMATLLILLTTLPANSEPLSFALYRLAGTERVLMAQDTLDYASRDVIVEKWGIHEGHQTWQKSLLLAEGFRIGVLITPAEQQGGFGLWIRNDLCPAGFSWEWFGREDGDIFKKLQGSGHVRVTEVKRADAVEIASVEFLSDVTLRFQEDIKSGLGNVTHEVVVSRGSVLRVVP